MIRLFLILTKCLGQPDASNSLAMLSGDLLCGLISGLVARVKLNHSVLAAVCIQNDLSNRKNNVVVEDFRGYSVSNEYY